MPVASKGHPKLELEAMITKSLLGYRELARKARINQKTLYEFRTRIYRSGPMPDVVHKLAKVLGVSDAVLLKAIMSRPFTRRKPRKKAKAAKKKTAKSASK